jgi:hypothetical protein
VVAAIGCILGLLVSYHLSLASGPCMVLVLGTAFLVSAVISPRHGLLGRMLRSPQHRTEADDETCAVPAVPHQHQHG